MNPSIIRALVAVCFGIALGPVCLLAQSPMRVTIPFDFNIGSNSFTAGDYTVKQDLQTSVVAIQSADNRSHMMTLTIGAQAGKAPEEGKLVFNRYGDQYFLSQVWTAGSAAGRRLLPSRAEKELIARASSKPVTLVASTK